MASLLQSHVLGSHIVCGTRREDVVWVLLNLFNRCCVIKISEVCLNLHFELKVLTVIEMLQLLSVSHGMRLTFKITGHVEKAAIDCSKARVEAAWCIDLGLLRCIEAVSL